MFNPHLSSLVCSGNGAACCGAVGWNCSFQFSFILFLLIFPWIIINLYSIMSFLFSSWIPARRCCIGQHTLSFFFFCGMMLQQHLLNYGKRPVCQIVNFWKYKNVVMHLDRLNAWVILRKRSRVLEAWVCNWKQLISVRWRCGMWKWDAISNLCFVCAFYF